MCHQSRNGSKNEPNIVANTLFFELSFALTDTVEMLLIIHGMLPFERRYFPATGYIIGNYNTGVGYRWRITMIS
jgi:hypothetical protein